MCNGVWLPKVKDREEGGRGERNEGKKYQI